MMKGGLPTATTYYKKHKISKGETIAQSLKERFDYGQNSDKTEGGELISSYGCDHMTADAEFLLSKAKYKAATGREQRRDADVLCYQIRQSFKPGEITPEEANRIGYETAMRWTKGKYAFFVATHTDKAHIHNHIYYNSTSLDCTRKFRDFIGSGRAVRRLSDRICLENELSVITNPKLHSKGHFLHYGAWLGAERQSSYKEQLRLAINEALAKRPADFDAFLRLMEASGFMVKHGRGGVISFLVPGQEMCIRDRMCSAIRSASHSSPGRARRRRQTASAMKWRCAGQRASTPFSLPPTRTRHTSTITFITIRPRWTAPGSFVISSALAVRCGGSLTASVLKMICPSLPTPSCTARDAFSTMEHGWGRSDSPRTRSGYGLPSMMLLPNAPPTLTLSSGSWRRPASRSSMGCLLYTSILYRWGNRYTRLSSFHRFGTKCPEVVKAGERHKAAPRQVIGSLQPTAFSARCV